MARKTTAIGNRLACQDVFLGFMDNLANSVGGLIEGGQRERRGMSYASRTHQFNETVNEKNCRQLGRRGTGFDDDWSNGIVTLGSLFRQ